MSSGWSNEIRAEDLPDLPPVAKNLELVRRLNGLSGAAMARTLGVEPMTYYRYRRGETIPPWERVCIASVRFQRLPEWFYTDHYAAWLKAGIN